MKKQAVLLAALLVWANVSAETSAPSEFTIEAIEVDGLSRLDAEALRDYIDVSVGDTLTPEKADRLTKRLYQTGFFDSVQLNQVDHALRITLHERPLIRKVLVKGNKKLTTEQLLDGFKSEGLRSGQAFNAAKVDHLAKELKTIYDSMGYFASRVTTSIEPQGQGQVDIHFHVRESKPAKIDRITFDGNVQISDARLQEVISLKRHHWRHFFSKADLYMTPKAKADVEAIRSHYLDRGFLDVKVHVDEPDWIADKKRVSLAFHIQEGDIYQLGPITLHNHSDLDDTDWQAYLSETLRSGDNFSREKMGAVTQKIVSALGEMGYAAADVQPQLHVDSDFHQVAIDMHVYPNQRFKVRHINIQGNTKTYDTVIRREIDQMEGEWLSTPAIELSQDKLNRTGFFSQVNFDMHPVDESNWVDVDVQVEEGTPGSFMAGVGLSSEEGLLFNLKLTNRNFMGTGKFVDLDFNRSKSHANYSAIYTNPYYTESGISRSLDFSVNKTRLSDISDVADYKIDSVGGGVKYGIPINDLSRLNIGLQARRLDIITGEDLSTIINDFINKKGGDISEVALSAGWSFNSLDRYLFPTSGQDHDVHALLTLPLTESFLRYYKFSYQMLYYYTVNDHLILNTKLNTAYGHGYKDDTSVGLPFFSRFFAGGLQSVRGFTANSLGPRDSLNRPTGGNAFFSGTLQASFPTVLPERFHDTVRPALFLDVGQVYDTTNSDVSPANPHGIRAAVGAALTWVSPIGPLQFSLASPIPTRSDDSKQVFTFSAGTSF